MFSSVFLSGSDKTNSRVKKVIWGQFGNFFAIFLNQKSANRRHFMDGCRKCLNSSINPKKQPDGNRCKNVIRDFNSTVIMRYDSYPKLILSHWFSFKSQGSKFLKVTEFNLRKSNKTSSKFKNKVLAIRRFGFLKLGEQP